MKKNYKKYIMLIMFFVLTLVIFTPNVMALDYSSICSDNNIKKAMKVIGYIVQLLKIIVPLIIIVLGMIDFGKATLSNDEKAISKAAGALIRRLIAGVVVFFIPTIVLAILNAVEVMNGIELEENTDFGVCITCIFDPINSCDPSDDNSNNSDNN